MARKRMIDPEFWIDEKLGSCNRDERLLFMGLISNADDKGRGRANPKLVKSTIFPYDEDISSHDINDMMIRLHDLNLIILYEVNNQVFYYLPNFLKHQVINKPQESKLPEPVITSEAVVLPYNYGSTTALLPPKRKEVKEKLREEKLREEKLREEKGNEVVVDEEAITDTLALPSKVETIVAAWNSICKNNPKVQVISATRREKIKTRLKERAFVEGYEKVFDNISKTDFLLGKNDRGWIADFDWIVDNDKNYVKVLEGKYVQNSAAVKNSNPFLELLRKETANEQDRYCQNDGDP